MDDREITDICKAISKHHTWDHMAIREAFNITGSWDKVSASMFVAEQLGYPLCKVAREMEGL